MIQSSANGNPRLRRGCRLLLGAVLIALVSRALWSEVIPAFGKRLAAAGRSPGSALAGALDNRRLPAEFGPQAGVVLATRDLLPDSSELLLDILGAIRTEVVTYILSESQEEDETLQELIAERSGEDALSRVHFLRVAHDSGWVRDYGPSTVTVGENQAVFVDWWYDDADRLRDDRIPGFLSARFGVAREEVRLRMEGGNLLSDGHGLCLTTRRLIEDNARLGLDEAEIRRILEEHCGCETIEFLEPLEGEGTGHVDMFATIVARGTVALGSFDPEEDEANAELLDRNAQALGKVARVHRVPMPSHEDGVWRTYTNVLLVNRKVLVPVYPESADPALEKRALGILRRLFPGRRIVPIDVESVVESGGAIHCITLNLPLPSALPELAPPDGAWTSR